MKIGILTQPLSYNYGGILQNCALQIFLKKYGHESITIDQAEIKTPLYVRIKADIKTLILKAIGKGKHRSFSGYRPSKKEMELIRKNTDDFIKRHIVHTPPINSERCIRKIVKSNKFDAFIIGSDQCWRPKYNKFIQFMYLSFLSNSCKSLRISYASSFGTDTWEYDSDLTETCRKLIAKFDAISVREKSAIDLCKKHFGVDAVQVLDPTMLLSKEEYIDLINSEENSHDTGDLFYYILDPNKKKLDFLSFITEKTNHHNYTVLPKYQTENRTKFNIKNQIDDCIYPHVTSWLKGILDAEMVITDSFHGVVFSIIFNKPFWALGNIGRGNTRFDSILSLFGLKDRLIDINSIDILNHDFTKSIDWKYVNEKLAKERIKSIDFICRTLSKNRNY